MWVKCKYIQLENHYHFREIHEQLWHTVIVGQCGGKKVVSLEHLLSFIFFAELCDAIGIVNRNRWENFIVIRIGIMIES